MEVRMAEMSDVPELLSRIAVTLERIEHELAQARRTSDRAASSLEVAIWSAIVCAVVIAVAFALHE
jgi:hypothetical protein